MTRLSKNLKMTRAGLHDWLKLMDDGIGCRICDRLIKPADFVHIQNMCRDCFEERQAHLMTMKTRPVLVDAQTLEYDSKVVWNLFTHNKNSTLDYGFIRNRIIRENKAISNDRQNAALNHLVDKGLLEKVSHGRWRYIKPDRPSAPVVASAPATPEEAAQVVPRFHGAMTDLTYTLLRSRLPAGLTLAQIVDGLGLSDKSDKNNCSASLQSLEKQGWVEIDRTNGRKSVYRARVVNALGKPPPGLTHAKVQQAQQAVPVQQALTAAAPAPIADQVSSPNGQVLVPDVADVPQARSFTLEQVKLYGELKSERARLIAVIGDDNYRRLLAIDAELKQTYGEG